MFCEEESVFWSLLVAWRFWPLVMMAKPARCITVVSSITCHPSLLSASQPFFLVEFPSPQNHSARLWFSILCGASAEKFASSAQNIL